MFYQAHSVGPIPISTVLEFQLPWLLAQPATHSSSCTAPAPTTQGCWPQRHPKIAQPSTNPLHSDFFFSACDAWRISKVLQRKLLALSCPACSFLTVQSVELLSEIILWIAGFWKAATTFLAMVKAEVMSGLPFVRNTRSPLQDFDITPCHRPFS